jgi:tRNA-splicing ligase RtcB (3'-phosphate/5'-hydroxy nucleic acid ligase)
MMGYTAMEFAMKTENFQQLEGHGGVAVKMWTRGVPVESDAIRQLQQLSRLPVVYPHVAAMPDVHLGIGATVGSVVPTKHAIIPAAVGVDIGCGMIAAQTTLTANDLPESLVQVRSAIEKAVPHGRSGNRHLRDKGAWEDAPKSALNAWSALDSDFARICQWHPKLKNTNNLNHLGTLGTGNHFVELCLDERDQVWVMLHSGSRGVGNAIGTHFIELAQADMRNHIANLPHRDLAYFEEGSPHFTQYTFAVDWAQRFAKNNRAIMMENTLAVLKKAIHKPFSVVNEAVNCHHNYVQKETHFGEELYVTRKGAVSAQKGQLGIIPGSMGAKSFIVRGLGNSEAFCSCSHGAGRVMSRTKAKALITLEQHKADTAHVECRKDVDVIDESPRAYKDIEAVMAAQSDLVEIMHTLRQVVCVKG